LSKRKIETPARAPRPRQGRGRQRQRLIDACISALHIYGPSRTTVEKVVAIAKMSPGIVRFYFDSKAAMLVASLQYLAAEFEEQVLVPVSKLKERPVAALELMVNLYLDPDIASPRKVSVWYAFWGEASSRQEYYDICGQKDESFAILVRELIGRLIEDTAQPHLDSDAVALGLIGVLEILWQDFAFQNEENIDRARAKRRAMAYLRSVFPGRFSPTPDSGSAGGARDREAASGVGAAGAGTFAAARPFASWVYEDSRAFAMEREALFKRAPQIVGHESELAGPGDFLTADTGAERVLVVRDAAGSVHALRNSCPDWPHALVTARSGRFAQGIECPMHGLAFGLDGAQTNARSRADRGDRADLSALDLKVLDGWLIVRSATSADAPPSLAGWLEARPPQDLRPLGVGLDTDVAADWKLLVELMLETAPLEGAPAGTAEMLAWSCARAGHGAGWSSRRYRSLAGPAAKATWRVRFMLPNQLLESRPDGLSIWQAIPNDAGRSRLWRLDYTYCASATGARAMQYLAARVCPRGRRSVIAVAESVQQAVVRFGYRATSAHPAPEGVRWFRAQLLARMPALALNRPPADQ